MSISTRLGASGTCRRGFASAMHSIFGAAFFCLTASGAAAEEPAIDDLELHAACSAAAKTRAMAGSEARLCTQAFLRIKLAFLADIDAATYASLSPQDRAAANRAGYAAYRAWVLRGIGPVQADIRTLRDGS